MVPTDTASSPTAGEIVTSTTGLFEKGTIRNTRVVGTGRRRAFLTALLHLAQLSGRCPIEIDPRFPLPPTHPTPPRPQHHDMHYQGLQHPSN